MDKSRFKTPILNLLVETVVVKQPFNMDLKLLHVAIVWLIGLLPVKKNHTIFQLEAHQLCEDYQVPEYSPLNFTTQAEVRSWVSQPCQTSIVALRCDDVVSVFLATENSILNSCLILQTVFSGAIKGHIHELISLLFFSRTKRQTQIFNEHTCKSETSNLGNSDSLTDKASTI